MSGDSPVHARLAGRTSSMLSRAPAGELGSPKDSAHDSEQGDEMIHHPALGSPLAPTPEDLSLHGATLDAACAAAIANTGGADNPFGAAARTWRPSVDLGPRKMSQDPERAVSGVASEWGWGAARRKASGRRRPASSHIGSYRLRSLPAPPSPLPSPLRSSFLLHASLNRRLRSSGSHVRPPLFRCPLPHACPPVASPALPPPPLATHSRRRFAPTN